MDIRVRLMGAGDRSAWAEMRATLWPEETAEDHAHGIDELLRSDRAWGFIAEMDGTPAGFAELAIRDYANGCASRPVPFLEGIFVAEEFRRRGIGAQLVASPPRAASARSVPTRRSQTAHPTRPTAAGALSRPNGSSISARG
jgi:GNAT superfamily N-acetyltransferase